MGNITVSAVAVYDIQGRPDLRIQFGVDGSTPEEQKKAADKYAEDYADWNGVKYRTYKTYIGATLTNLQEVEEHVKHVFGF
ncbi:MAG: hypothetical protein ACTHME_03345 [Candidatus Nitrosocosmicus sp.]